MNWSLLQWTEQKNAHPKYPDPLPPSWSVGKISNHYRSIRCIPVRVLLPYCKLIGHQLPHLWRLIGVIRVGSLLTQSGREISESWRHPVHVSWRWTSYFWFIFETIVWQEVLRVYFHWPCQYGRLGRVGYIYRTHEKIPATIWWCSSAVLRGWCHVMTCRWNNQIFSLIKLLWMMAKGHRRSSPLDPECFLLVWSANPIKLSVLTKGRRSNADKPTYKRLIPKFHVEKNPPSNHHWVIFFESFFFRQVSPIPFVD